MTIIGRIQKGAYYDSVTLMNVGKQIVAMDGVVDAAIVMGTRENKAILAASNLLTPEFEKASDTDMLIGINLSADEQADDIFAAVDEALANARKKGDEGAEFTPMSLDGALDILPDANLAMISVAGRYAGELAMGAIEKGLHVMLFSDNVPLETEIALKKAAQQKGLLVMGPDCGTAIINGVPLAFANVVEKGNIGVVAASGTGLQEVSCIIANQGCGISQAIGTGGRDVKEDVGGIMFIEALKALAADDSTDVILLVSKPPHPTVLSAIREVTDGIDKPVVSIFLGAEPDNDLSARTLEEAALKAVALAEDREVSTVAPYLAERQADILRLAEREAAKRRPGQRFIRGLFSGGTFCSEAQILFAGSLAEVFSNAPTANSQPLADIMTSTGHTVIDMGEDEFTVGRPHPMIDFSLRNKRITDEANDPETAVILLDVVLGYGSNMDPASELESVVKAACNKVCVVCSVTGTDRDPQNLQHVQQVLSDAGAIIMPSNAAACELAGAIASKLEELS
jgi:succinyl-CoA synthetase alpha subunit